MNLAGLLLVVLVLLGTLGSLFRASERKKHHDRCAYCDQEFRFGSFSYRYPKDCPKCGKRQPWAVAARSVRGASGQGTGAGVVTMRCSLGHDNEVGKRFCGECGEQLARPPTTTPVAASAEQAAPPTQGSGLFRWFILGALGCLVMAVVFGFIVHVKYTGIGNQGCTSNDPVICAAENNTPTYEQVSIDCGSAWITNYGNLTSLGKDGCNSKGITRNKWLSGIFVVLAIGVAATGDVLRRRERVRAAAHVSTGHATGHFEATNVTSASTGPSIPGVAPEGWYPDPERFGQERLWDGQQWTEQRRSPS